MFLGLKNERAKIWIEREVFLKCIEDNPDGTKRFDKYKFAELIIEECFKIVDDCEGILQQIKVDNSQGWHYTTHLLIN
jgi:hypothetical protein